jgi:CheY-like chemotaxis protein
MDGLEEAGSDAPIKVLVIEDDALIRLILMDSLIEDGMQVDVLANAEDALILLGAGQVPDVLVTDIDLGAGLHGVDLADIARARHPDVEVVFISGKSIDPEGRALGAHERLLMKPFSASHLALVIREAAGTALGGSTSNK